MVIQSYHKEKHLQIAETQFWNVCINFELNQPCAGFLKKGSSLNSPFADQRISAEEGKKGGQRLRFPVGPKALTSQRDTSKANMHRCLTLDCNVTMK